MMAIQAAAGWSVGRRAVLALLVALLAPGAWPRLARARAQPAFFADGTGFTEN